MGKLMRGKLPAVGITLPKGSEQSPTKIFVKYEKTTGFTSVPKAIKQLSDALVIAFAKDKEWFDQVLINAVGVTRVWVTKEVKGGVKRIVSAEVHALKDYDAAAIVAKMRESLRKMIEEGEHA